MTDEIFFLNTVGAHPDPAVKCIFCNKRPFVVQVIDATGSHYRLLCNECSADD